MTEATLYPYRRPTNRVPKSSRDGHASDTEARRGLRARCFYTGSRGPVAELVEQGLFTPKVAGSRPARPIGEANCPAQRDQWRGSGGTGRSPQRTLETRAVRETPE